MNKISNRRLARGFVGLLKAGDSPKKLINQLAAVIVEDKKTNQLDLIISDIKIEFENQLSTTSATVYSSHELSSAIRAEVAKIIKKTSGTSHVELDEKIDPSLLGGVKIDTPEREIDLSLRGRIKSLKGVN